MNTKVNLIKTVLSDGVRFDLFVENMPENFLGLAADLKFDGEGNYLRMEFSDQIVGMPFERQPVKMVKEKADTLIMGMTFKAADLPKLESGVLASFFFDGEKDFKAFENKVFSIHQNQSRMDLQVDWIASLEGKKMLNNLSPGSAIKNNSIKTDSLKVETGQLETNLGQIDYASVFAGTDLVDQENNSQVYFIVILIVMLLMGGLHLLNNLIKKSRKAVPSLT